MNDPVHMLKAVDGKTSLGMVNIWQVSRKSEG